MKILIDMNLSPEWVSILKKNGLASSILKVKLIPA